MMDTLDHIDAELLSAYADGELNAVAATRVERHVNDCASCRDMLRKVRELVSAAHALPREIAPPPEVWGALRERVAHEPFARPARRWWHNGWLASAAAIVLVAGTALLMSGSGNRGKAMKVRAEQQPPMVASPVVLVERNYAATVTELREALDTQRPTLSPTTVRTVERALAVIDSAIGEARAALTSDPANQALVDILSAHYERKVELLQRATELSSSL